MEGCPQGGVQSLNLGKRPRIEFCLAALKAPSQPEETCGHPQLLHHVFTPTCTHIHTNIQRDEYGIQTHFDLGIFFFDHFSLFSLVQNTFFLKSLAFLQFGTLNKLQIKMFSVFYNIVSTLSQCLIHTYVDRCCLAYECFLVMLF